MGSFERRGKSEITILMRFVGKIFTVQCTHWLSVYKRNLNVKWQQFFFEYNTIFHCSLIIYFASVILRVCWRFVCKCVCGFFFHSLNLLLFIFSHHELNLPFFYFNELKSNIHSKLLYQIMRVNIFIIDFSPYKAADRLVQKLRLNELNTYLHATKVQYPMRRKGI